jgi:hypothetical protein
VWASLVGLLLLLPAVFVAVELLPLHGHNLREAVGVFYLWLLTMCTWVCVVWGIIRRLERVWRRAFLAQRCGDNR